MKKDIRDFNILLFIMVGFLGVSLIAALYRINSLRPLGSPIGAYQTDEIDGKYYNAQFYGENEYYLEIDDGERKKFSQGVYESIGHDNYMITDMTTQESTLITLRHRGFYYYYKPIDKVLYFVKKLY